MMRNNSQHQAPRSWGFLFVGGWVDLDMRRYLPLLLFIGLTWGQNCTADDGTQGVELWGECYSIQNTTELQLNNNELTDSIPPEIGNLTNLTYLDLRGNQLIGEIPPIVSKYP
jgi:hypothetical protein